MVSDGLLTKGPQKNRHRLPQADGGRKPLWRLGVSADLPEVFDPRNTASWQDFGHQDFNGFNDI